MQNFNDFRQGFSGRVVYLRCFTFQPLVRIPLTLLICDFLLNFLVRIRLGDRFRLGFGVRGRFQFIVRLGLGLGSLHAVKSNMADQGAGQ